MVDLSATIAPLLGALFLVLLVGVLLRTFGKMNGAKVNGAPMGQAHADVLNTLIVDVTMPALIISVLAKRDLVWSTSIALVPATVALVVTGVVAWLLTRALGADRKTQGAAVIVTGFCNTGFLGFPLLLALFPDDAAASSTALLVDTVDTTLLLWTVGLAIAYRLGSGERFDLRAAGRVLLRPLTLSIFVGLALRAGHVTLPGFVDGALAGLGHCTSPLVFLSLGLQLDIAALKGRVGSVLLVSVLKLALAPLLCLAIVRALSLVEPVASVVVLQCAMPSAMAGVIVVARGGCDRAFAAGVATATTIACVVTLPAIGWVLELTR